MRVIHAQAPPGTTGGTLTARLKLLQPSADDLVDGAFLLVIGMLALVGFVTSFDSVGFLGVAATGLVLGVLAGHVVNRLRWSWAVAVLIVGLGYFLLGGPLAVPRLTLAGLPTAASVASLGGSLITGWMEFLTTLAPVPGDGPALALPLVLALLTGSIGHCVARRSKFAWTALLAPLVLFVLVIALGTLDAPLLLPQGLGFAALTLGWLAVRFPRRRQLLGPARPGRLQLLLGTAMLGAALLGGAVLAPVVPGVSEARRVIRAELEPPIDVRQYPTPLGGFRTFSGRDLKLYWDTPLLQVDGVAPGALLRMAVLDQWSGATWSGLSEGSGGGFQRLGALVPDPPQTGVQTAQVRVLEGYAGNPPLSPWVPSLGPVVAIEFAGPAAQEHRDNYRFNLATDQGFVPDRFRTGDQVTIQSAPLPSYATIAGDPAPGDGERSDDAASPFLAATTQRLASGEAEPWAQLGYVAQALKRGAWSDGTRAGEQHFLPGHGQYRLTQFVNGSQFVGSDEQYAATFALIAGRLGYPARVVFGARVPAGGEVRGKDVQAWVEVSVRDHGWVSVPAEVFTPDRTKKPELSQNETSEQDSPQNVPPPNPVPPPGNYDELPDTDPAAARAELPAVEQLWRAFWAAVRLVGPPLLALLLIAGTILGLKARRRHGRRTRGAASTRIAGGWDEVLDAIRDGGRAVPAGATRLEASALLGRVDIQTLATGANAAVFGAAEIADARVADYWREVTAARETMVGELPWWRRPLARLNLASLVHRRRGHGRSARHRITNRRIG